MINTKSTATTSSDAHKAPTHTNRTHTVGTGNELAGAFRALLDKPLARSEHQNERDGQRESEGHCNGLPNALVTDLRLPSVDCLIYHSPVNSTPVGGGLNSDGNESKELNRLLESLWQSAQKLATDTSITLRVQTPLLDQLDARFTKHGDQLHLHLSSTDPKTRKRLKAHISTLETQLRERLGEQYSVITVNLGEAA